MADARVALIGYGLAGEAFHAPLVHATRGLELAAVVTQDPTRRAGAAARYPHAQLFGSPDEIWSEPGRFDLVVVAAPNRAHVELATRAVDAGLAVVVDKPLAITAADAVELRDAATARGVPVAVFQNRRWDGDFLTARQLIADGALGSVHTFESRFDRWRPEVKAGAWRESPDPADGGGLLFDLGSHLIDQAHVLFGPVDSVFAEVRAVRPGARVDDDVFVVLHHRSGTVSHLGASMVVADLGPRMRGARDPGRLREVRARPSGGPTPGRDRSGRTRLGGRARGGLGSLGRKRGLPAGADGPG